MFRIGQMVVATGIDVAGDGPLPRGVGIVNGSDGNGLWYVEWPGRVLLVYPQEIRPYRSNPLGGR